jgi:hypothetical protein
VIIFWNLTFNWIDILYQVSSLWKAFNLVEKEWTKIGILLAMMISDVLFKSPVSDSWSFENSSVMNEEWGEPIGFFEGIKRELDGTLEYFGLESVFGETKGEVLENDAENAENYIEQELVNDTEETEDLEEETEEETEEEAEEITEEESDPAQGGLRVGSSNTNYNKVNVRKELLKSDRRLEKLRSMKECLTSKPGNSALKEQSSSALFAWKSGSLEDSHLD